MTLIFSIFLTITIILTIMLVKSVCRKTHRKYIAEKNCKVNNSRYLTKL